MSTAIHTKSFLLVHPVLAQPPLSFKEEGQPTMGVHLKSLPF
jgi:hypothetical protein